MDNKVALNSFQTASGIIFISKLEKESNSSMTYLCMTMQIYDLRMTMECKDCFSTPGTILWNLKHDDHNSNQNKRNK